MSQDANTTFYCTLRSENSGTLSGWSDECFSAIGIDLKDDLLSFTLQPGKKRIVNFRRVIWLDIEEQVSE